MSAAQMHHCCYLVITEKSLIVTPIFSWHKNNDHISVGDIVLFLKSDKEFDDNYQYGRVCAVHTSQDGRIRKVDVEYKNHSENVMRVTKRGIRDLIIVYPYDELDIYECLARSL